MASDFHTHDPRASAPALISAESPIPGRTVSLELHPWKIGADFPGVPADFPARLERCAALGEIGFDALRGDGRRQLELLPELLELAVKLNRPVVLHLVRPGAEVLRMLEYYPLRYLVHGFRGGVNKLAGYLDRGWFVSLGSAGLESPGVAAYLRSRGLERIGFETDSVSGGQVRSVLRRAAEVLGRKDVETSSDAGFKRFLYGRVDG